MTATPASAASAAAASAAAATPEVPDPAAALDAFSLKGCSAVVTGASAGLGRRFCAVLAAAGAEVFAAARRLDRLHDLAQAHPRIHPVHADVAADADREALVRTVVERTGRFDVLVNNAGVGGHGRAREESTSAFRGTLEVNLVAPFHLACLMAAVPRPAAGKAIVNVASILGLVSAAPLGGAAYSASKGGLIALTRELAGQWGRDGVRVNALAPGWFRSEMTADLFADGRSADWVDRNTLLRRPGGADELDGALLYLASPASSYTTGQVLVVDGGWTAR